jgi:hypothetical protein
MKIINKEEARQQNLKYYFTSIPCRNGHISRRYVSDGHCLECRKECRKRNKIKIREQQRKFRENNPNYTVEYNRKNPKRILLGMAKYRAKKENKEFNLTLDDIPEIPEFCPYLGLKLRPSKGKANKNSPSLDRINNKLGYVKGNIIVVSYRANALKSDAGLEELQNLTFGVRKAMGDQFVEYGAYI